MTEATHPTPQQVAEIRLKALQDALSAIDAVADQEGDGPGECSMFRFDQARDAIRALLASPRDQIISDVTSAVIVLREALLRNGLNDEALTVQVHPRAYNLILRSASPSMLSYEWPGRGLVIAGVRIEERKGR